MGIRMICPGHSRGGSVLLALEIVNSIDLESGS